MKTFYMRFPILILIFWTPLIFAEPWLATRFAQNCAACHAPGRVNVEAPKRRCTLSCQGCHTNPNGGGLRNWYGKWNQERWLNSFYLPNYKLNKKRPAVLEEQTYGPQKLGKFLANQEKIDDPKDPKNSKIAKWAKEGFEHKETTLQLSESEYDRRTTEEKVVERNRNKFMLKVPQDDPLRQKAEYNFMGGGDFRYLYLNTDDDFGSESSMFPMAADVGASVHPIKKLTFVTEARFLNAPSRKNWDELYTNVTRVKSAYVLVDDLPYNSFVMYGLYRPMFGYYTPDHETLFSKASGFDVYAHNKALTVGTAPNVPFLNVHMIMPESEATAEDSKGYAANLGLRFVTLGANIMLSYWNTTTQNRNPQVNNTYMALTGGFMLKKWIFQGDFTKMSRERVGLRSDSGAVITLENRFRFWKEFYGLFSYEMMNTALNLSEGESKQWSIGMTSFPISSVQFDIIYRDRDVTVAPTNSTGVVSNHSKTAMAQVHWFY